MLSEYDVLKWIERKGPEEGIYYDKETDRIIDSKISKDDFVITLKDFTNYLRKQFHCDFDCIYSDPLDNEVLKCNECGTIIFTTCDEWWDPNLCCPVCGGYKHISRNSYWTKEEIKESPEKQNALRAYSQYMENQRKCDEWYSKRKKKYEAKGKRCPDSDELWVHKWYSKDKKKGLSIALKVNHLFYSKLKGLHIEWNVLESDDEGKSYFYKTYHTIPLSPWSIYIYWILPHTKKYKEVFKKKEENKEEN